MHLWTQTDHSAKFTQEESEIMKHILGKEKKGEEKKRGLKFFVKICEHICTQKEEYALKENFDEFVSLISLLQKLRILI